MFIKYLSFKLFNT